MFKYNRNRYFQIRIFKVLQIFLLFIIILSEGKANDKSNLYLGLEEYWLNEVVSIATSPAIALAMSSAERNFLITNEAGCLDKASKLSHKKDWTTTDKYNELKSMASGAKCLNEEYKSLIYQILEQAPPFEGGLNDINGNMKDSARTRLKLIPKLFTACVEEVNETSPSKRPPAGSSKTQHPYLNYCTEQILTRKITEVNSGISSSSEQNKKRGILDNYDSSKALRKMKCWFNVHGGYYAPVELKKDTVVSYGKELNDSVSMKRFEHKIIERDGNDVVVTQFKMLNYLVTNIYDFKNKKLTQKSDFGSEVMECM